MVFANVADDDLTTETDKELICSCERPGNTYVPVSICYGLGHLLFYIFSIIEDEVVSSSTDGDEKQKLLAAHTISRVRRHQSLYNMIDIKLSEFMSINSSIGWPGISISPIRVFYSGLLQQNYKKNKSLHCCFKVLHWEGFNVSIHFEVTLTEIRYQELSLSCWKCRCWSWGRYTSTNKYCQTDLCKGHMSVGASFLSSFSNLSKHPIR